MLELEAELQVYNRLKARVEESTFKKDLQRNIQVRELLLDLEPSVSEEVSAFLLCSPGARQPRCILGV